MAEVMTDTLVYVTMKVVSCYKCGIQFGMTSTFRDKLMQRGGDATFYCPNGHGQCYGESEAAKIKKAMQKQIDDEKNSREYLERKNNRLIKDLNSERGKRGAVTKKLNRVKNGVCPCCNRTFQNLMQHMSTQHPEFKNENK